MIYMFKLYDLKELKAFDLFRALEEYANSSDSREFNTMEDLDHWMKDDFDSGSSSYVNESEYLVIIDADKKKIIKRTYTLNVKVKTFKSEEAIQKQIDLESKKAKETQKKRDAEYAKIKKELKAKK